MRMVNVKMVLVFANWDISVWIALFVAVKTTAKVRSRDFVMSPWASASAIQNGQEVTAPFAGVQRIANPTNLCLHAESACVAFVSASMATLASLAMKRPAKTIAVDMANAILEVMAFAAVIMATVDPTAPS